MADITLNIGGNTRQAEKDIQKLVNRTYNINLKTKGEQPLGRITGKVNEFTKSLDASNARVIAFGASAGIIFGVQKAFNALISSTIEVQKSLQDINVILNVSASELQKFGSELFNIAKNTGQSFDSVAKAATEFSRQGLGVTETLKRTNEALILSRLSGLDAAKSVEALTAAVNSYASQAVTATEVVNKFANVDAAFAVSSADLAEALARVGSSAAQSGVNLNELIAIVTSAQQTTARGGAVIGNSFKTIFTRLQRGKVVSLLESLGISSTDASGQVKSTIQLLQDLGNVYNTLGAQQQAYVAEQVGGVFQINILKAALADLGKEYSIYNSALNVAAGSTDQAIRRNEELNKTYAAQINALQENAKQLAASAGERLLGPSIDRLVGGSNLLLGGINESDGQSFGAVLGKGILDGLGQFIAGPGLALIGGVLLKLFRDLTKFATGSVQQLLGLNTAAVQQRDLQESINQILAKNPKLLEMALKSEQGLNTAANTLLASLQKQTVELQKQATVASQISKALVSQAGVRMSGGVPIAPVGRTGKAAGYIPNFAKDDFAREELLATALGARNPTAQLSKGTIDGKKFIKNNREVEITGFGRNGDSAVIPNYAKGFIPNFATGAKINADFNKLNREQFISKYGGSEYQGRTEAAKQGVPYSFYQKTLIKQKSEKKQQKELEKEIVRRGILNSSNEYPVIVASGPKFQEIPINNFLPTSKALEPYVKRGLDPQKMSFLKGSFTVHGLDESADEPEKSKFENIVRKNVDTAGREITTYVANAFQGKGKIQSQGLGSKYKDQISALSGFLFEDVVSAFLPGPEFDQYSTLPANARFDFPGNSPTLKNLFDIKGNPSGIEAKLNAGPNLLTNPANPSSLVNKIYSIKGFNQPNALKKSKNKAAGYIPNFAAIQDAVARERAAGIPSSQIYLAQEKALKSANPMGLGVFNKRDEPTAGKRREQMRRKGFANGYIPNFAIEDESGTSATTGIAAIATQLTALAFAFAFTGGQYKESLKQLTQANRKRAKEELKQSRLEAKRLDQRGLGNFATTAREDASKRFRSAATPSIFAKGRAFGGANAFGLSAAAPILGETLKNVIGEETAGARKAGDLASGLGQIGSFAATGALIAPGPIGAGVGAAVGALLTVPGIIKSFTTKVPELAKATAKASSELTKFSEAGSRLLSSESELRSALSEGASQDKIEKITAQYTSALSELTIEDRNRLENARKNGTLEQEYGKVLAERIAELKGKQLAEALQKSSEETGLFGRPLVSGIKDSESEKLIKQTFTNLLTGGRNDIEVLSELNQRGGVDTNQLLTIQSKAIKNISEFSDSLDIDFQPILEEFQNFLNQRIPENVPNRDQQINAIISSASKGRDSLINTIGAVASAYTEEIVSRNNLKTSQDNLLATEKDRIQIVKKLSSENLKLAAAEQFALKRIDFTSNRRISAIGGQRGLLESIVGSSSPRVRRLSNEESVARIEADRRSSLLTGAVGLQSELRKIIETVIGKSTAPQTTETVSTVTTELDKISNQFITGQIKDNAVFDKIQSLLSGIGISIDSDTKISEDIQNAIIEYGNIQADAEEKSRQELVTKLDEQIQAIKTLKVSQALESFGGIKSFIGQDQSETLVDKVVESITNLSRFNFDNGAPAEAGRESLRMISLLRELSGGAMNVNPQSEAFLNAVQGRTQDIQTSLDRILNTEGSRLSDEQLVAFQRAVQGLGGPERIASLQVAQETGNLTEQTFKNITGQYQNAALRELEKSNDTFAKLIAENAQLMTDDPSVGPLTTLNTTQANALGELKKLNQAIKPINIPANLATSNEPSNVNQETTTNTSVNLGGLTLNLNLDKSNVNYEQLIPRVQALLETEIPKIVNELEGVKQDVGQLNRTKEIVDNMSRSPSSTAAKAAPPPQIRYYREANGNLK